MRHKPFAFAIVALFSLPAVAAPVTYTIEGGHTLPRFSYNHLGFSTQLSRFNQTSGTITLDREAGHGRLSVTVDTRSVDTGSPVFDSHIQGDDYLKTASFPAMTFTSDHFHFNGEMLVAVDGILTLKGISRPVRLEVTTFHCGMHPMLKKEACGADAQTLIKRSDFNMGKYVPMVGDEVTVSIPVEAVRD